MKFLLMKFLLMKFLLEKILTIIIDFNFNLLFPVYLAHECVLVCYVCIGVILFLSIY